MGDGTTIGDDELSQRLGDQQHITGAGDAEEQQRAAPGEGVRAPLAAEGADHAEFSIFDGKGNEQVVAVGENEDGQVVQSSGESSEEAKSGLAKLKSKISDAFGPDPHKK